MLMETENYDHGDYNWWAAMHSTAAFSVPKVTGYILFWGLIPLNFMFHMSHVRAFHWELSSIPPFGKSIVTQETTQQS